MSGCGVLQKHDRRYEVDFSNCFQWVLTNNVVDVTTHIQLDVASSLKNPNLSTEQEGSDARAVETSCWARRAAECDIWL